MKRTTVFLDEPVERDLQALARRDERPMAALVREALAEYVTRRQSVKPARLSFVAAGKSGRSDTAEQHETLVWRELEPHGTHSSVLRPRRPAPRRKR